MIAENKTRHNKTGHDRTKQDMTEQNTKSFKERTGKMAKKKETPMQYAWKQAPSNFRKADAQKVGEEIGDSATPEEVLAKAEDPNSELHKCFEWDDTVAAKKYRLMQARQVIQFLVIKGTEKNEHPVRAFQISSEPQVYRPTIFFVKNEDEYTKLLARAKAELKQISERYKQLAELEEVFEAIARL